MIKEIVAQAGSGPSEANERSTYERFAIPYSFKPQLSVPEAIVAAAVAFVRIFLGSILFAVWGASTLVIWSHTHGLFLRIAAVLPVCVLFLLSLGMLMWAISAVVLKRLTSKPL